MDWKRAFATGSTILTSAGAEDLIDWWRRECWRARAAYGHSFAYLREADPAALIVATQQDAAIRSWLLASRELGIPTVYLPHAPVARKPQYLDLPTDFAGVRGPGETAWYMDCGAETSRIEAVGNPGTNIIDSYHRRPGDVEAAGVLAISPDPEGTLRAIAGMVRDSGVRNIIVAPHPASNLRSVEEIFEGFSVWRGGRTADLLLDGPPFVLQYSSGIAWEAAILGIRTAQFELRSEELPDYPFLDDEDVFPRIRSGSDLADFAKRSREARKADVELVSYARNWCSQDGSEAVAASLALIGTAAEAGAVGCVLDGWRAGGAAARSSTLADHLLEARDAS